ncbi:MAG: Lrp/AsnC family transcriptional regulator [Proteobacteria bacterium]|nr:Lrp/AsnC family transcriptional regulator [Pseudomonadota bacterium]MBU1389204.1 Lrp/AsnC family transcriptional regulator [Pseudomonadota bacterium]MBU1543428.1 Lrp/AsnC family transcriptional regulator [Pseudomonadota bacterium]MBU2429114.1 Lrp/AsnC family transcriptional regulator [Pseudomonadota bacterium]MBU2480239.1 Lrp/AsnC family transcriptional regulator [Pseudomonadota bacterium]
MKIDETNIEIIKELRQGKKSFKKIADKLSITENTVRSRVNNLQDEGILEICGLVEPSMLPDHKVVIIGIRLSEMNLVEKGEEISKLKGVISVSVVTGRYDLIVLVLFKKGFGLLEFYTEEISQVQGVRSVETFVVYKSYNLKVPYIF